MLYVRSEGEFAYCNILINDLLRAINEKDAVVFDGALCQRCDRMQHTIKNEIGISGKPVYDDHEVGTASPFFHIKINARLALRKKKYPRRPRPQISSDRFIWRVFRYLLGDPYGNNIYRRSACIESSGCWRRLHQRNHRPIKYVSSNLARRDNSTDIVFKGCFRCEDIVHEHIHSTLDVARLCRIAQDDLSRLKYFRHGTRKNILTSISGCCKSSIFSRRSWLKPFLVFRSQRPTYNCSTAHVRELLAYQRRTPDPSSKRSVYWGQQCYDSS